MSPAGSPPRELPSAIGRYRILGRLLPELHEEVYEGFDPMIERPVVVRVFSLDEAGSATTDAIRQTFFSEMQRTGMLAHPGISTLFDAGELPGALFMASEHVAGPSLAERLADGLALTPQERITMVILLADALDYAREQGVPHLDIRPSNIMIGADLAPKIRGFGVAGVEDALGLRSRAMEVSESWTAPERLAGEPGDARSDVFALARLAADILGDGTDTRTTDVADVFQKASAPAPAERFETVGAFKYALLLSLGLDETDVRLASETSREASTLLSANRAGPALPQSAVNGDLTSMLAPTQLTPSGVEDMVMTMAPRAHAMHRGQHPEST